MPAVVVARFGELFLKGANRGRFEAALHTSCRRALAGMTGVTITAPHGRVVARVADGATPTEREEIVRRLGRVFGIVSLSPGVSVARDLDAVAAAAMTIAAAWPAGSFKVEARRSDKSFPLPSPEIAKRVGAAVVQASGRKVDVHTPALQLGVEMATDEAFVFGETRPGPGGLPAGSAGRALLLLSGGIDSPVAGWLAAKRGLALDAVYFHSPPFVGERSRDKVLELGRKLASWQAMERVFVVSFTDVQKRLREAGPADLAVVLYRRMMMRIADEIADRTGAQALITGENLGQVASQTVTNLGVIDAAARHLVLRPLVTYDKLETIAVARRIGTFDTSILPYDDCCSLFVPTHPATAARLGRVEAAESKLDLATEAATAAAAAECIKLDA